MSAPAAHWRYARQVLAHACCLPVDMHVWPPWMLLGWYAVDGPDRHGFGRPDGAIRARLFRGLSGGARCPGSDGLDPSRRAYTT